MKNLLLFITLLVCTQAQAQITHSAIQTRSLKNSVHVLDAKRENLWQLNLESIPNIVEEGFGNIEEVKLRNKHIKLNSTVTPSFTSNKTAGAAPIIGQSFIGTQLKAWTPSDNAIAISNDGWIVSAINQGMEVYDENGNAIVTGIDWNTFLVNDPDYNLGKFDPRVIYDPYNDRFIMCILHGPGTVARSKIILAFSATNNPTQGWYIYDLDGNPFANNAWTDFPSMAVNEHELFINCNLFEPAPNYNYKGTYIQQIDLDSVYAGGNMQFMTWGGFNENKYITLVPAPEGHGNTTDNSMDFVMMNPGQGNTLNRFTITDTMNSPTVSLDSAEYTIPAYTACADAYMKDIPSGNIDSLSTGSCWVQNAFKLDDKILFTFSANVGGWCGVHLGELDLTAATADYTSYSVAGTDMAYPAIASIGYNDQDKNTAMVFVRADTNTLPEVDLISIDNNKVWSARQTVKAGDTIVNIIGGQAERWGDYSDIKRKYNETRPEAWLFGCYGANTLPRRASYGNWIAQVLTNDAPVQVNDVQSASKQQIDIYPNPVVETFTIDFELKTESLVSINLYDVSGRKVKELFNDKLPSSRNKFSFNRKALPNGQYFVEVNVSGERTIKQLIIVK